MWDANAKPLGDATGTRYTLKSDGLDARYADVVQAWRLDAAFRSWWNALLVLDSRPKYYGHWPYKTFERS